MSESEPSMTHRKDQEAVKTGGAHQTQERARRAPAYCSGDSRCIGGMSAVRASARNTRTCRLMQREMTSGETTARKNTDAADRGGAARSSDEGAVTVLERRGSIIHVDLGRQPAMRGGAG